LLPITRHPDLHQIPARLQSPPAPETMSNFVGTAKLSSDEIAMLLNRGTDFFKDGDVVSARLLFRRAIESEQPN
jgi:hypothetical protein